MLFKIRPKVESVIFKNCNIYSTSWRIAETFPKLNYLKIANCSFYETLIMIPFPNLKTLDLVRCSEIQSILQFLRFNPQLTELNVNVNSLDDIRFIAEKTLIEKFKLNTRCISAFPPNTHIHFNKLKHFAYIGFTPEFPFTFDQLKSLEVKLIDNEGLSINQIDDIIKRNGKLTEICILTKDLDSIMSMSKEFGNLSKITFKKLIFELCHGINETMVEFLNEKSFATNITFEGTSKSLRNDLQKKIDKNKWNLSINTVFGDDDFCRSDNVILKRKI